VLAEFRKKVIRRGDFQRARKKGPARHIISAKQKIIARCEERPSLGKSKEYPGKKGWRRTKEDDNLPLKKKVMAQEKKLLRAGKEAPLTTRKLWQQQRGKRRSRKRKKKKRNWTARRCQKISCEELGTKIRGGGRPLRQDAVALCAEASPFTGKKQCSNLVKRKAKNQNTTKKRGKEKRR